MPPSAVRLTAIAGVGVAGDEKARARAATTRRSDGRAAAVAASSATRRSMCETSDYDTATRHSSSENGGVYAVLRRRHDRTWRITRKHISGVATPRPRTERSRPPLLRCPLASAQQSIEAVGSAFESSKTWAASLPSPAAAPRTSSFARTWRPTRIRRPRGRWASLQASWRRSAWPRTCLHARRLFNALLVRRRRRRRRRHPASASLARRRPAAARAVCGRLLGPWGLARQQLTVRPGRLCHVARHRDDVEA